MTDLGVVQWKLEQIDSGTVRFSCLVGSGSSQRMVRADGQNEGEAVRRCLDQARQTTTQKR